MFLGLKDKMISIIDTLRQLIYTFMGFILGIVFGVAFALTGLTVLLSPIPIGVLFIMTLIGIFFGWGLLKKDKIEQRKDIKSKI